MGRPEPVILFAQTIIHSQLDEYVDEVLFSEPVIITACEFLEQNASPSTPNITLVGATSPPSFALEVFVHCEGESRFRRLCQPFLYSHSSSNVLEVEAIVTNHLVLRGTYRSLTLVVYGNIAEDLGQFNIELDLDNSLANVVSSPSERRLEDLPPALNSCKLTFEGSLSSLPSLSFRDAELDLSTEVKQILLLFFKVYQMSDLDSISHILVNPFMSALSDYAMASIDSTLLSLKQDQADSERNLDSRRVSNVLSGAKEELVNFLKSLQSSSESSMFEDESVLTTETALPTTEALVQMFTICFPYFRKPSLLELPLLSQDKRLVLALGLTLLLCSSRESCFYFVNAGGMEQFVELFCRETPKSTAIALLLLGIIEHATRHGVGCEAFLGWWPRKDDSIPVQISNGYCFLLKLLLEKERHDIASLATYILQRLRFYEILSRYEFAVEASVSNLPVDGGFLTDGVASLSAANAQLKEMLNLINLCGPIEDPSAIASARHMLKLSISEGLLSYKATVNFINSSKYSFAQFDIDLCLLSLLKERGFFPLSAALLSSAMMQSASGSTVEILLEIASSIESVLLSLLFCRSGLFFLLSQPEATELIILSLRDAEDRSKTECITLRQATTLLSKGFFCRPHEVGIITELHLKVGSAVNHLLAVAPNSDELLWVLWELCAIARSDSGRQALLAVGYFSEAVSVLLSSLCSYKDLDTTAASSGGSPLGLAIFHSAAEILEVLVTDCTASSLKSWIGLAVDLHKALHSSSPGSNRKDAPTRLLEWIDAGVVYQRNGAIGLLRYAAILASGGDAHLSSANVLVSDSIDVENLVAESSNSSDGQVIDNLLGKFVSDKYFDGVALRSTSIIQLTTAFRILAFISEDSAVSASLFEEGAVTLSYVVLLNCKSMLERLSNNYDYLVDEGAELSSTNDLLLDRTHEQSLVDLMIPLLVFLINLLHKLHETKEQYRNKKLLNALLQLHREVSPKLAACAADLSFLYPSFSLNFGVVCHLITSALACWPLFGWTPGLFHCLLENVQATSASLALGPKDACSLLCLLGDLFPDEGIWLWKNEIPSLSAIRSLSTGTVLGPLLERETNWYLQPEHLAVLLMRLTPQLDRIARVVENVATSSLMVIQDMLRVFIVRIASQKVECAVVLLRPIFSWLNDKSNETSLADRDIFKVHQLLCFIASLSEHPKAKAVLCKMGFVRILGKVLRTCSTASYLDENLILESTVHSTNINLLSWRLPVFKSLAMIFSYDSYLKETTTNEESLNENVSIEECSSIISHLLKLCQVVPVGRELLACALTFKELVSSNICISALGLICSQIQTPNKDQHGLGESASDYSTSNVYNWRRSPPLLKCWSRLVESLDTTHSADFVVETIYALTLGAISLSMHDDNLEGIMILKFFFGLPFDVDGASDSSDEKLDEILQVVKAFDDKMDQDDDKFTTFIGKSTLFQVKESVRILCSLLQSTSGTSSSSESMDLSDVFESPRDGIRSVVMTARLMPSVDSFSVNDEASVFSSNAWKFIENEEKNDTGYQLGGSTEKFVWELSDSSVDRQASQSARSKLALGSTGKRVIDNQGSEAVGQPSRNLSVTNASSGPTRRDTFRQRKPNTSRPPSMHVDDYVARERNVDVSSGSNIVINSTQRGQGSGRPPSIHVDEFMARQRERQNSVPTPVADAPRVKNEALLDENDRSMKEEPRQMKADLDDDQEIDIVFDEETGPDDKLPFPHPDDSFQSPPVIIGENSPGPIVEEAEGDQGERNRYPRIGTPLAKEDDSLSTDSSSRTPMMQGARFSLEKNLSAAAPEKTSFHDQAEESKYVSPNSASRGRDTFPSTSASSFPSPLRNVHSAHLSGQQFPPPNIYQKKSPQTFAESSPASGSQAHREQKLPINQPPLPPMPPPSRSGQSSDSGHRHSSSYGRDAAPPLPSGYPPNPFTGLQFQPESIVPSSNGSSGTLPNPESKFSWNSNTGNQSPWENFNSRPMSTLPPQYTTPFSGSPSLYQHGGNVGNQPFTPSSLINDAGLGRNPASGNTPHSLPPFAPQLLINRPSSLHGSMLSSPLQQAQFSSGFTQNLSNSQPSSSSVQSRPPPPPPPLPPQVPHPSQAAQQRASIQLPQQQSEQAVSYPQGSVQVQMPLQFQQQLPIPPPMQFFYQSQQESISQQLRSMGQLVEPQNHALQTDSLSQQHDESGFSLQQFFSSPEAIQSLLSDREKLCQLLEQHPKLMQMLQDRLGQL